VKVETAGLPHIVGVKIFLIQFKVGGTPILETDLDVAYIHFYGKLCEKGF